jgi:hypothetical protein
MGGTLRRRPLHSTYEGRFGPEYRDRRRSVRHRFLVGRNQLSALVFHQPDQSVNGGWLSGLCNSPIQESRRGF